MSFRVRILEASALRDVTPAALRAYAMAQGWQLVEPYGSHSDVYQLEGVGEAIIPGTTALSDYARIVSDLIELFAKAEDRDQLSTYRDLSSADQDVVRVRAPEAEDDGSVQLETGVELIVHARDLLLAAACSASDPRPAYRAGRVKAANDYLERVRMGQTERGSFIVTMLSPVPPTLESTTQPSFWPSLPEEPFARRVTRRLVDGLEVALKAVEQTNRGADFGVFVNGVPQGISANLCEAAANLIVRGDGLNVTVTWARTRPTPEKIRRVNFSPSDADVLREAARIFRDREPRPDETLEGFIIKLARDEEATDGNATLRTTMDDQYISVRMDLPQLPYEEAVRAHEGRFVISIRGDLEREGQRWRLRNPRELNVIEADDPADDGSVSGLPT